MTEITAPIYIQSSFGSSHRIARYFILTFSQARLNFVNFCCKYFSFVFMRLIIFNVYNSVLSCVENNDNEYYICIFLTVYEYFPIVSILDIYFEI